jgi:hypothetical protein
MVRACDISVYLSGKTGSEAAHKQHVGLKLTSAI